MLTQLCKERLDEVTATSHYASSDVANDVDVAVKPSKISTPATSAGSVSQGSYSPQAAGFARLVFDNRYSRINGKHIALSVQIVGDDVLQVIENACQPSGFSKEYIWMNV